MIGRVRESRNPKKVIRVTLMESYGEIGRVPVNLLEIEVFDGETDVGDVIEDILPKYMYREQYRKCVKTLEDLYCWTEDSFLH